MGHFFINAEFLAQRFHCEQVLATDRVVVHARVKFRQLNGDIDRGNRVGSHQMHFGVVNLVSQLDGLLDQLFVQRIVIILFAGEIHCHNGFPAFRPRLVFHHPDRARAFTQQMPVGWCEDHGFQLVMLMRHLQQQVVSTGNDFLDDGFERPVMPHHFNINGHTRFQVIFSLFADPRGTLADHALTHRGALVRRQKGGHLIREVIDRQKRFDFATNPLM